MRTRFLASLAAVAVVAAIVVPAAAEPGSWVEPPGKLPQVARGDRIKNLDFPASYGLS
jgi:hypothetical protein